MQSRTIVAFCALLASLACLVGCTTGERTPELLHLTDILPREADVGDRMEILGAGFPEGRPSKVAFAGTLFRPGQKPKKGFEIALDAVSTSASRVELIVSESVRAAFCGTGDFAIHTTFEGNVLVSFPGAAGMLPVQGSLRHVRIDFRPPLQRKAIVEARMREGERALELMGIEVASDNPASGGLLVTSVGAGSSADQAGIFPGDLITSFDSVRVFDLGDVVPGSASRFASIGLVRGSGIAESHGQGREVLRSIALQGFKPNAPTDLIGAGLLLLLPSAMLLLFMGPLGRALTWVERRVAMRIQSNGKRPRGLAWLGQMLRSFLRENVLPHGSDEPLSRIAPIVLFLGTSSLFVVMPFGQHIVAADLDIGVLFVVAVTWLVTMSLLSGGFQPNEGRSVKGGLRAAGQIISYEIPGAIAIACIVTMTGSLRVDDIVLAQGGWPWQWFVFKSPITFALFFLWMATSLFGESRGTSDIGEASLPAEVSSLRRLLFFFAEWGNVFVMCGLASVLFLGGWQLPGTSQLTQESSLWFQALGAAWFQLKSWGLVFLVVVARWTLPRARVDRAIRICWKWLVPATSAAFLLTMLWMQWSPPAAIEMLVAVSNFAFWLVVAAYLVARLWQRSRAVGAQAQLNPFL